MIRLLDDNNGHYCLISSRLFHWSNAAPSGFLINCKYLRIWSSSHKITFWDWNDRPLRWSSRIITNRYSAHCFMWFEPKGRDWAAPQYNDYSWGSTRFCSAFLVSISANKLAMKLSSGIPCTWSPLRLRILTVVLAASSSPRITM